MKNTPTSVTPGGILVRIGGPAVVRPDGMPSR